MTDDTSFRCKLNLDVGIKLLKLLEETNKQTSMAQVLPSEPSGAIAGLPGVP